MLATAVNPSVSLLFRGTTFPVKIAKISLVAGNFGEAPRIFAAICCISGTELRDINRLVLIFFRAPRAGARGRQP
jgi:hypothetical protein